MIGVVVFDLDGTIKMPDRPVELEVVERVNRLVRHDVHVSLVSGKNAIYLFGVAEGIGIPNPLVAGENGGVIFRPLEKVEIVYHVPDEIRKSLDYVVSHLTDEFGDSIWFPLNRCGVTAFPKSMLPVDRLYRSARDFVDEHNLNDLYVLPHWDAVDILPKGLDKGVFVDYLNKLGYPTAQILAVGDALNDIPMFKAAGRSVTFDGSEEQVKASAELVVADIYEAFNIIEEYIISGH